MYATREKYEEVIRQRDEALAARDRLSAELVKQAGRAEKFKIRAKSLERAVKAGGSPATPVTPPEPTILPPDPIATPEAVQPPSRPLNPDGTFRDPATLVFKRSDLRNPETGPKVQRQVAAAYARNVPVAWEA